MKPILRKEQSSAERPDRVHGPGTSVTMLEPLAPDRSVWLVEIRVPEETLVSEAWFDCIEVRLDELAFDDEIQDDMLRAAAAAEAAGISLGEDTDLREVAKGALPRRVGSRG